MANIDERIKQCEAKIKVLQEQRSKLLTEKKKEEELKPGDVVTMENYKEDRRLIVEINGVKHAVDQYGNDQSSETWEVWKNYRKIGRCTGFTVA
uniref:Uncharacterized protein n=2 Tax=viral metagenome TaxID=1070528 RepID=A0A6M3J1W2_9ZZZZ